MIDYISLIEKENMKKNVTDFNPGDLVRVHVKIIEGEKERIQIFEGLVIGKSGGGMRETFRVRRMSYGVGVEKTFPVHAPVVDKIEVIRKGKVNRAKLYFLAEKSGKEGRVREEASYDLERESGKAEAEKAESKNKAEVVKAAAPEAIAETKVEAKPKK